MSAELGDTVIVICTSGSPSFRSTRRFIYTVCGIHMYKSVEDKEVCEKYVGYAG